MRSAVSISHQYQDASFNTAKDTGGVCFSSLKIVMPKDCPVSAIMDRRALLQRSAVGRMGIFLNAELQKHTRFKVSA